MNHRVVLLLLCVGLLLVGAASAWYDADWDYRKEFTLNNTGSNLTNYQLMFTVNRSAGSDANFTVYLDSKCAEDYDDIRFVGDDDATEWDYWIESNSSTVATIWVEVPLIPNSTAYGSTTGYIYYGNSGASAASDGDATFLFFDDFPGSSVDPIKWDVTSGLAIVSDSKCTLTENASTTVLDSLATFDTNNRTRTRIKSAHDDATATEYFIQMGSSGYTCVYFAHSSNAKKLRTNDGSSSTYTALSQWTPDVFNTLEISRISSTSVKATVNGDAGVTATTNLPTGAGRINVVAGSSGGAEVVMDWVLIRKYAATEPTLPVWGSEEFNPSITVTAIVSSVIPSTGYAPLLVTFTDGSTSGNCTIDYWNWTFGDTFYGYVQNPQHMYLTSGVYPYWLEVGNISYGIYDELDWSPGIIEVWTNTDAPDVDFTVTETCGETTDTFYFIDFSTGGGLCAWNWSFGDGNYSELRNPTHQYAANGTYDVNLTVWGAYGNDTLTKTDYITVPCGYTPPSELRSNFTSNVTTGSIYPLVVQFTDTSTGSPTAWNWSFGDGRYSEEQNPIYHYAVAGKYNVSLNASNSTSANITEKIDYINLTSDNDDYLVSWLHMNGTAGSTTFTDEKGNNWIPSGAVQLVELIKYFGSASGDYSGSKPYIYTASSNVFDFSSNDFTIEMWVNVTSTGNDYPIIQRGNNVHTNGWGMYHSTSGTGSDAWKFYMGSASANSTGTVVLPPNIWNHLVITRESGTAKVYVNGTLQASKSGLGYNFDAAYPIYLGFNPNKYFNGYIDEFRISNGIARWKTNFTTPYAEYRGTLETIYPDINPNSTLRYKTSPSSYASIANQTDGGTRNRTLLLENVYNTSYVTAAVVYDPLYVIPLNVSLNTTVYSTNMTLLSYNVDSESSTVKFNVSRLLGFNNGTLAAPIVDIQYLYYNYTDDPFTLTSFSYGHLINGTTFQSYPIHNFITTNMTLMPWNFTADFSANTTTQTTGGTIVFNSTFTGAYPNSWNWSWGDGEFTYITIPNTTPNTTHVYSTNGTKTVILTSYLWQNSSIQNVTTKTDYINITGLNTTPTPTPTPTPTTVTTTSSVGGYNVSTDKTYATEDVFIPFWFWAFMIIVASVLLIVGVYSDTVVFSMISFIAYITMAYASPTVGFFYNEMVLTNSSTNEYTVIPIVFQIIPPWISYVLLGLAVMSMLHIWSGIISWLNARKMESYQNETVRIRFEEQEEEEDY